MFMITVYIEHVPMEASLVQDVWLDMCPKCNIISSGNVAAKVFNIFFFCSF